MYRELPAKEREEIWALTAKLVASLNSRSYKQLAKEFGVDPDVAEMMVQDEIREFVLYLGNIEAELHAQDS